MRVLINLQISNELPRGSAGPSLDQHPLHFLTESLLSCGTQKEA